MGFKHISAGSVNTLVLLSPNMPTGVGRREEGTLELNMQMYADRI